MISDITFSNDGRAETVGSSFVTGILIVRKARTLKARTRALNTPIKRFLNNPRECCKSNGNLKAPIHLLTSTFSWHTPLMVMNRNEGQHDTN